MGAARLTIDLDAIAANWQRLARMSATETGATVKADAYGLGAAPVAKRLAQAGVRSFFVALAEEGAAIRQTLGAGPRIFVFSGHMPGDTQLLRNLSLIPVLNSPEQLVRHFESLPGHPFGIQLDSGMNRLGMEAREWQAVREMVLEARPELIMSHLACSDEPDHLMNAQQLEEFTQLTEGCNVPRSLAATGGILLGPSWHFDLTRPGIGLYGAAPFEAGQGAVRLELPVIQERIVEPGEVVGYSGTWVASRPTRVFTVAAGYADGILRALSGKATLWAGETPCPVIGRISMDLITVDASAIAGAAPEALDLISPNQRVDALADQAGTIGYEILTSLGNRYRRRYLGAQA